MKGFAVEKIKLLTFGAKIAEDHITGRKSGAGPAGGGYFEFLDGPVVNVPLRGAFIKKSPLELQLTENDEFTLIEGGKVISKLRRVPSPQFLEKKTLSNIPMREIALLHGKDCLATTVVQNCTYWPHGLQCKFCGIELSWRERRTSQKKTPEDLAEVLRAGLEANVISHVTLTSGSLATRDLEVDNYCRVLKALKSEADIPMHVQIEPLEKPNLERLKSAGADTIGIHLENYDPKVLQEICPGKYQTASVADYYNSWKSALEVFGDSQVSTFILMGLGERRQLLERGLRETIEMGVIPFILPVRPIIGTPLEEFPGTSFDNNLKTFELLIKFMKEFHLNPHKNKGGCVRCGACSAVNEAYTDF